MAPEQLTAENLPTWVTLREACFLTGLDEQELRMRIGAGEISTSPLGRGAKGSVLLKTTDLPLDARGVPRAASPTTTGSPSAAPTATRAVGPAGRVSAAPAPIPAPRGLDGGLDLFDEDLDLFDDAALAAAAGAGPDEPGPSGPARGPGASAERWRDDPATRRKVLFGGGVALGLVAVVVVVAVLGGGSGAPPPAGPVATPTETSLAWGVSLDSGTRVALLALPKDGPGVVVAMSPDTQLDLPSTGPISIGVSATSPGLLVADAQMTMLRRVDHYLMTDGDTLARLVDRLGGITVDVVAPFTYAGVEQGTGPTTLSGGAVRTYLQAADAEGDAGARWTAVLRGLFAAPSTAAGWKPPVGDSDLGPAAAFILARAAGGQVIDLPTEDSDIGLRPDRSAVDALVETLDGLDDPVIRVSVLNGNGAPGLGSLVNERLAPHGFLVLTSQSACEDCVETTQVLASSEDFLPQAERAREALGVGDVFLDPQPTGISDLTIVVGKDFPIPTEG
jgi:hypothetical protein